MTHSPIRQIAALFLLALATFLCAGAEEKPAVLVPHVSRAPRLEDFVNGTPREAELKITDFRQRRPQDGSPASAATTAFLSYDDRNLYVAFVCKANPHTLRAHLVKREDIAGDDQVSVSLDTFHDGQRAYEFFANPLGIQSDAITSEGAASDDYSFDTEWQSKGRITADGYVVMFSIPFRNLRFNPRVGGSWGIALGRLIPGNNELSTWPHLTEKIEAYVPQFAGMNGPDHAHPAHNMQFIPYAFVSRERTLTRDEDTGAPLIDRRTAHREGLDAKIVIHDSLTLDATVNPDFSQVESDEPQVTTNQRYEVFFPEKRPFFLENSDYFDTPETLLFTRRIVDPQFGARLTGKLGNWKIGMLAVDDRAPGRLEPETSPFDEAHALNFAGRIQRLFGGGSSAGVMFTRRQFGNDATNLGALDTRLKLGQNWVLTGQYMGSYSTGNRPAVSGTAAFSELRYSSRQFNSTTSYTDRSADFGGNDLGFFRRTDIRQAQQKFEFLWHPEKGALLTAGPLPSGFATWNHSGVLQDWAADLPLYFSFKGPGTLTVGRTEAMERYQGIDFRKNSNYISFSTDRLHLVGISGSVSRGKEINFFPAAGALPVLGDATDATAGLAFRPGARLQVKEQYLFSRLHSPSGLIFENHRLRTRVNYQFSRPLSLRAIIDYNALGANPSLVSLDGRARRLNFDVLLTYLVHPGTALYVGYSDEYQNLQIDPADPFGLRRISGLGHPTARQLFVKLSYSFRY